MTVEPLDARVVRHEQGGQVYHPVKTPAGWRFKARVHLFPPEVPGSFVFPEDR